MELGKLGVWCSLDGYPLSEAIEAAQRIEALGYPTLWHPEAFTRDPLLLCASILGGTRRLIVANGIVSIYDRVPAVMASAQRTLDEQSGGRFLLGLGVSHPVLVEGLRGLEYGPPVATMRAYLDAMDTPARFPSFGGSDEPPAEAPPPPPPPRLPRVLAALGPRMLALTRDRADGAHPYFMPPEHTRRARELLGPDRLLCPELKVVLETEPSKARELARAAGFPNITLPNYQRTWRELGYDDADFADGGSDRFIDATVAWGNVSAVERMIQAHLDAGASHVCIQLVNPAGRGAGLFWEGLEALAPGA